jgi:hypothetical protein
MITSLFTSCTDQDHGAPPYDNSTEPAQFTSNIIPYAGTYATTTDLNTGEVVIYTGSSTTGKTYITSGGELIPKTTSDEIFLSSTPTLFNAFYPKSELTLSGSDLLFTLNNTIANKDVNKDIVYATANLTKDPNNSYTLTFSHLFSLLEIEFVKGTTTEDISTYYPVYRGKNNAKFKSPYSNTYILSGTESKFYFFDGSTANTFGCIIPSDMDAYLTINNGTTDLPAKSYIKDIFTSIEAGKKYKITITFNQDAISIGNVSVENWTDGGNSTITIIQ